MQFVHPPTFLPSSEYHRLQSLMLGLIGSRTAFASILRRKLGSAKSVLPSAVAREIAVNGMRIWFRVDGHHSEERIMTWQPPKRGDTVHLSLLSPRGLALLGLSPGESVSYRTEDNRTEFLKVEKVSATDGRRTSRNIAAPPVRDILDVASCHSPVPEGAIAGGYHV